MKSLDMSITVWERTRLPWNMGGSHLIGLEPDTETCGIRSPMNEGKPFSSFGVANEF